MDKRKDACRSFIFKRHSFTHLQEQEAGDTIPHQHQVACTESSSKVVFLYQCSLSAQLQWQCASIISTTSSRSRMALDLDTNRK